MSSRPKTLILFYVLVAYILLQFVWWTYLLTSLTGEVFLQKETELKEKFSDSPLLKEQIHQVKKKQHSRMAMIIGEGSVFLILLGIGIYRVKKSFEKETQLASQQKNFMLSVTHELKTPLAAVKLNLQTLEKRELDKEKQRELIQTCLKETDRLNQLIENVLLAARAENAELRFTSEKINLAEFIETHLGSVFRDPRIVIQLEKEIYASTDRIALASILTNLVENALKYSEENVIIKLFLKDKIPVIEVADTGPGIPSSEKENIFKKFYRIGNEETRRTKGTGLGLFIVKFLTEKTGITLQVTDNSPKGSVFRLIFPDQNRV